MFDKSDPRSSLLKDKTVVNTVPSGPKFVEYYKETHITTEKGSKSWWSRGQNFYLCYSEAVKGEEFIREQQNDEYVVILPESDTKVKITTDKEEKIYEGFGLVIVPPGFSNLRIINSGTIVRLLTTENKDLHDLAINEHHYVNDDPNVRKFNAWPKSPEGEKIRYYSFNVPKEENRFGRIFRCSTFMVNFLEPKLGPRDPSKLSPHVHNDFEQCSLTLSGDYIHHLRWPWTTNKSDWREDEHKLCSSPSMTIMPPGVIHTSEAVGLQTNQLVDIFCPPRKDFSEKEGWVLNEKDYPISYN